MIHSPPQVAIPDKKPWLWSGLFCLLGINLVWAFLDLLFQRFELIAVEALLARIHHLGVGERPTFGGLLMGIGHGLVVVALVISRSTIGSTQH